MQGVKVEGTLSERIQQLDESHASDANNAKAFFDSVDKDASGNISRDEFISLYSSMREAITSEHKAQRSLRNTLKMALYGAGAAAILGGIIWLATDGAPSAAEDTPSVGLFPTTHGLIGHATWSFE